MPNRPEWLYTFFALAKIGAVVVPINTRFRTSDLAYVLWQSDATTLITVDCSGPVDYLAMVHEICPSLASSRPGHLHVEEQQIGPQGADRVQRRTTIGALAHDGHLAVRAE